MSDDPYSIEAMRAREQRREAKLKDGRYKADGRHKICTSCMHALAKHPKGKRCSCVTCTCRRFVPLP